MFLHLNRAIFVRVVSNISAKSGLPMEVVEKDYYITMILKQFSKDCSDIIFKGGTSLSKAHHVLNRFSEDIDLTFDRKVTEGQRKKLKHNTVLGIGKELKLEITGLERTRSKRDYNGYTYHYLPLVKYGTINSILAPQVRVETVMITYSYPTEQRIIDSYVGQYLRQVNPKLEQQYGLQPFEMRIQRLERTFIDKVFAICDYYVNKRVQRCSRHLYDLYVLQPHINFNADFLSLIHRVRQDRAGLPNCPTASPQANVNKILQEIYTTDYYMDDYLTNTMYITTDKIPYAEVKKIIPWIINSKLFVA